MATKISIHWFRQDLRISDNPALTNASQHQSTLPIYIFDDINAGEFAIGGASRWWLFHSLGSLAKSLGGNLSIYKGNPIDIFKDIITRFDVGRVCWNRCYEPWQQKRDLEIKELLSANGIDVTTTEGSLLWEPWKITKGDGTSYKVFTPYFQKGCLQAELPRKPLPSPRNVKYQFDEQVGSCIKNLNILPKTSWFSKLETHWQIGEANAQQCFQKFLATGLKNYKGGRDIPAQPYVSRLSPHLHFGEISPNELWHSVRSIGDSEDIVHFCSELVWREFSYYQLYHNPELPRQNLNSKFNNFPWVEDEKRLRAWQLGNTGIPMVDAGMRELWQTGYMHNRVRMIVGSFLVKNLLIHWHHGERWFWDTLVDADLANNCANWQWVSGCGVDAAPYFRIFNPVLQGQKFDPDGSYVRKYVPELAKLPNKYLFNPWDAPELILKCAGITLGDEYPVPIVDLKQSRNVALAAYQSIRS